MSLLDGSVTVCNGEKHFNQKKNKNKKWLKTGWNINGLSFKERVLKRIEGFIYRKWVKHKRDCLVNIIRRHQIGNLKTWVLKYHAWHVWPGPISFWASRKFLCSFPGILYRKLIWALSRENLRGFPTNLDSNQSHQLQRLARILKVHWKQV